MFKKQVGAFGFTIVELLVVIVVIGILAAITIVSFSNVSNRAIAASLQSDLNSNANQLKMYHVEYDVYPSTLTNNCPTSPNPDNKYCLKVSSDAALSYVGGGQNFILTESKNGITYTISESSSVAIATPITAIATISGTPQVGQTLMVGALTPSSATASYQWQNSATLNGTYSNISGATSSTYTIVSGDVDKYIKVIATGMGLYSGVITSGATTQVIDPDWQVVNTQIWAKTNMNIGDRIEANAADNSITEKVCYSNLDTRCTTYGGLYQWDEAMQYSTSEGAQGICPAGSHIPTYTEWSTLNTWLGGTSVAGTELKTGGSSGLNMKLTGFRSYAFAFGELNNYGYYWTSTQDGSSAWAHYVGPTAAAAIGIYSKLSAFPVRCIRNS